MKIIEPKKDWTIRSLWIGLVVLSVLGSGWMLMPSLNSHGESAGPLKCASNLRQIGQGILLYSNEFSGQFPPSLALLLSTEELTSEVFICPISNDTLATSPPTQTVVEAVDQRGHCSYGYLGQGLTNRSATPSTVVAYELADNHTIGRNVLFGDGHVERMDNGWFKSLTTQIELRGSATQPVILDPSR